MTNLYMKCNHVQML